MPDPASDAPPVVSPTVADLLAAHGTLIRGAFARFYAIGSTESVAEPHVVAAIADGSAFASQLGTDGKPFAVTAYAARLVTAAAAGTAEAGVDLPANSRPTLDAGRLDAVDL